MSANLNVTNGKVSMAYVGEIPWHGKGQKVENAMTSAEAIKQAGLDWEVGKRSIFTDGNQRIGGFFNTFRMDTGESLGVVKGKWQPLQNKDAFSFMDSIVGIKAAMYHTAGALGKGERIWMLAKLPESVEVVRGDVVDQYLLLANSHDRSLAITVMFTPIRIVCQNTLTAALGFHNEDVEGKIKLRHTGDISNKTSDVQEQLGIIKQTTSLFKAAAKKLVGVQMTKTSIDEYIRAVFGYEKEKELKYVQADIYKQVMDLFESGRGNALPGVKGSLWAAYNGVAEYVDFKREYRVNDVSTDVNDARTRSILFGSGLRIKEKAMEVALGLVKAK